MDLVHLDGHEIGAAVVGDGFGDERFAAARRPVQQHARGGGQAQRGKALRALYWLCYGERQLLTHLQQQSILKSDLLSRF